MNNHFFCYYSGLSSFKCWSDRSRPAFSSIYSSSQIYLALSCPLCTPVFSTNVAYSSLTFLRVINLITTNSKKITTTAIRTIKVILISCFITLPGVQICIVWITGYKQASPSENSNLDLSILFCSKYSALHLATVSNLT